MKYRHVALLLPVCIAASLRGGEPFRPLKVSQPPVIDGYLNDPAWENAPMVEGFRTYFPDYGKEAEQQTRVWMSYDPENLYFAFRCLDDPAQIKASMSARDNIRQDDWIGINLDTFGDQQSLFIFYVNPNGIQSDTRYVSGNEDIGADYVWSSAGRIHDEGYDIEIRIPLKSIRYSDNDPVTMGVIFERWVSKTSTGSTYPALDPKLGESWQTQTSPLVYYKLKPYTLLEVLPAFVYNEQRNHQYGKLSITEIRRDDGLTLKYGITSDLVIDGTYNPDFSQIEADAGQVDVNLRYALFYPEKRPFFLEGREYFAIAGAGDVSTINSLVHTRNIADPKIGLKLSGKVGRANIISLLYANDELANSSAGLPDNAHGLVVRYRRVLDDDSYVGTIATSRSQGSAYNAVAGFDGIYRFSNNATIQAHVLGSRSKDAPSLAHADGYAVATSYDKNDRDIGYGGGIAEVSTGFRSDLGYLSRTGLRSIRAYVNPRFYPESSFMNRILLGFQTFHSLDIPSDLWETNQVFSASILHLDRLAFTFDASYATEVYLGQRFRTSSLSASWGGQLTKWLAFRARFRSEEAIFYNAQPFSGTAQRATSVTTFQPWEDFVFEYTLTYAQFSGDTTAAFDYSYPINRFKLAYQVNKYLFFRWITEYNGFRKRLPADFLASFTYIPGTVIHVGYGMIYNRQEWDPTSFRYQQSDQFLRTNSGLFFKASYLWRL